MTSSMRFSVVSGTDIQEFVERHDSATLALDAVERLIAQRLPNIRVLDEKGANVPLADVRELAVVENESDDA